MPITQFNISIPQNIRFGRGIASDAPSAIAVKGKHVLLVTGANPNRSDWLYKDLLAAGCYVHHFSTPHEPDLPLIEKGVEQARETGV